MRKTILSLVLGTLLLPALAEAQATVDLRVNLPVVLPRLVVVQPGVQVVPEVEEEVFFVDRYYWVRREGAWYRSGNHRGGWMLVPPRAVPGRLVKIPPGHYKHWKADRARAVPAAYERGERGDHDRGDHDRGEGHGRGHDKPGKHGKHGKHGD